MQVKSSSRPRQNAGHWTSDRDRNGQGNRNGDGDGQGNRQRQGQGLIVRPAILHGLTGPRPFAPWAVFSSAIRADHILSFCRLPVYLRFGNFDPGLRRGELWVSNVPSPARNQFWATSTLIAARPSTSAASASRSPARNAASSSRTCSESRSKLTAR